MALGLIVFPIDFVLKMVGVSGAGGLVAAYLRLAQAAFAPQALPTWLPRLVLLVLGGRGRRRARRRLDRRRGEAAPVGSAPFVVARAARAAVVRARRSTTAGA